MVHHTTEAAAGSAALRPRWAPVAVIVLTIFALVLASVLLAVAAPERAEGTVGLYERVTLRVEEEGRSAIGGFVAPQGWLHADEGEDEARSGFVLAQAGPVARLDVSLRTDARDQGALLRDGLPAGASLTPTQPLELGAGVTASSLDYDLQAGDGLIRRIAVCSTLVASACLLFETTVENGAPREALGDVLAAVQSAEVL